MSSELMRYLFGEVLIDGLLASSAAVVIVLLLRRHWSHWFGAGHLRFLWLLVPAAMLAVTIPPRTEVVASLPAQLEITRATQALSSVTPLVSYGDWFSAIAIIWLAGVALFALHFVRQQIRFNQHAGRMSVRADSVWIAETADIGPAVVGLLRPRIVVPADFEQRFDAQQQALILAHERSHLRGGDLYASAFAAVLRTAYWFNPLLHLAAKRMRQDHELASDADVVRHHPYARRRYADTLLNAQLAVPGLPVGCPWQSSHPLKERIIMLKSSSSSRFNARAGTAVGLGLSLCVSAIAWAAQPAISTPAENPAKNAAPLSRLVAGKDDSEPSYNRLKPPTYPKLALDSAQAGSVVLRVSIDPQGRPSDVVVEEATNPGVFDEAAINTVKTWTFNPATREGKPAASTVLVPICFSINEESECPAFENALDSINIRKPPTPEA